MIQRMSIRPFANITGLDLCDIGRNTVVGKPRILQLLLDTFCTKAIEIDNVQNNAMNFHRCFHVQEKTWCLVPEAGLEPARLSAGDFESPTSTNFTTRACYELYRLYPITASCFSNNLQLARVFHQSMSMTYSPASTKPLA